MRRQSRLAIGALVLLPTIGVSAAVPVGAATTPLPRAPDAARRSVSAHRSAESAVIPNESDGRRPAHSLRPLPGDLPTNATLTFAAWVLVAIIAALMSAAGYRLAPRGRAPPIRFL